MATELSVVVVGVLLGGVLGVGTILYAVAIGPLSQALLPVFVIPTELGSGSSAPAEARGPVRADDAVAS